jgi:hypothetical protein
MSKAQVAAARLLGKRAAQLDQDATACPYDPRTQPAQARAWVSEFLRWKPAAVAAVSYGDR